MFDEHSYFRGKRLHKKNVEAYLRLSNLDYKHIELIKTQKLDVFSLIQKDCALLSVVICVFYWVNKTNLPIPLSEIYIEVKKLAEKYKYNKFKNPLLIKKIYSDALDYFTIGGGKVNYGHLKNVGYSLAEIKQAIDCELPIILYLLNDGKSYYKNHIVTIVGYEDYLLTDIDLNRIIPTKQKQKTMLLVYDNWTTDLSYIDFDKISFFSDIQY